MSLLGNIQLVLMLEEVIVHMGTGGMGRPGFGVMGCAKLCGGR